MADDIEPHYSDTEVARMIDPSGRLVRPRSIRSEREAGRLQGTKIAGKWLYRRSDVALFLERARPCPAVPPVPASVPTASPVTEPDLPHRVDRGRPHQEAIHRGIGPRPR